jgi:glycosyltransferase involved in cell wall biosynthesis
MNIVIDIVKSKSSYELNNDYFHQTFSFVAKNHPSHQFIFLTDKNFNIPVEPAENIRYIQIKPVSKILRTYWYSVKLPGFLHNLKTDYFFSQKTIFNRKIKATQFLYVESADNIRLLKKRTQKAIGNHSTEDKFHVIVPNDYIKDQVEKIFHPQHSLILTIPPGIGEKTDELSYIEKESKKKTYTNDCEFFFFDANGSSPETIKEILRGFSVFKKWQKSSMKMLILNGDTQEDGLHSMLSNYKYKEDVVCLNTANADLQRKIIGSAYAAIVLPDEQKIYWTMQTGISIGTVLILPNHDYFRSNFSDFALYAEKTPKSVAEKLMQLYKDEALKNELSMNGKKFFEQYTDQANLLWNGILQLNKDKR